MREILTGDMIHRALLKKGLRSDFIYLCDDMDPPYGRSIPSFPPRATRSTLESRFSRYRHLTATVLILSTSWHRSST